MSMVDERKCEVIFGRFKHSLEGFKGKLRKLLETGPEFPQREGQGKGKFIWAIADFLEDKIDGKDVFFGRLLKTRKKETGKIFDEKKKTLVEADLKADEDQPIVSDYSNFVIDPSNEIILFEERNEISVNQFKENFEKSFRMVFDFRNIELELLERTKDVREVYDLIGNYERVSNAKFEVEPSNPETAKEFQPLDDELQESNTDKANLEFDGKDEGLKVRGTILGQAIALSENNYGIFKLLLERDDGQRDIYESKEKILKRLIYEEDKPSKLIKAFYEEIKKFIREGN